MVSVKNFVLERPKVLFFVKKRCGFINYHIQGIALLNIKNTYPKWQKDFIIISLLQDNLYSIAASKYIRV